ncbi:MAG TPA: hypothetical protein GXX43_02340 [Tepidanaerobacter syntrophicus]|uniref:zinc ribbon domain-containing protein n=1 Tax=Tepidanaerobacter syntrophicus TaxID=224999 RepID=UPI00175EF7F6|nr:C4-type zinc ribbon domain-containing protein [Tepidanaerobacter syntrophicus]HHV82490.1 hypothetical protein [Tepidanaerobacter syntrophicus]
MASVKEELILLYEYQTLEKQSKILEASLNNHMALKELGKLKREMSEEKSFIDSKRERFLFLDKELKKVEKKINEFTDEIRQFEERIYGGEVTTIKELNALKDKQELLQDRTKKSEESAIEMMEEIEILSKEIEKSQEIIDTIKKEYSEKRLKTCQELGKIKEELESIEVRKTKLENTISPELLNIYKRIKKNKPNPVAPVIENSTCGGCMTELSIMIADEVMRSEKIVYCEHCGRILVKQ